MNRRVANGVPGPIFRRVRSAVLVVALSVGCGAARHAAVTERATLLKAAMRASAAEIDLGVARAAAPAMLKLVEGLLETVPDDHELLEIVARGWIEYAFGFLEDDLESLPAGDERLALRA